MFERSHQPIARQQEFLRRLFLYGLLSAGIVFFSLALGVIGYHFLAGLTWTDSLLNASMILGGMGPVAELDTDAAKVFASLYALYSGMVLLVAVGVLIAPVLHRFLHYFHLEIEE